MTQDLLQHEEDGVLTLTFNRTDKKNAITVAMYAALADALEQAAQRATVHVLVIQGDVAVFTAGNDILDFQNALAQDDVPLLERPVGRFLHAIATFPKPLVAAVCGPAVGVGVTLLLHCDLVFCGDNAMFSLPFVNLGLVPEAGSSLLLPQMLGYRRAAQLLLTGEAFSAETALEFGLINRIVPPEECNAYTQAQAARLAAKPATALMEAKRLMKGEQQGAVLARIAAESEVFARLLEAPAAREAFAAFAQKREPDFSAC